MSLPGPAPRGVVVTAPVGGLPSPALAQDQFEGQVEWAVAHPAKSSEQSVCVCGGEPTHGENSPEYECMKCEGTAARSASCSGWGIADERAQGCLGFWWVFFLLLNIVTAGKGFGPEDAAASPVSPGKASPREDRGCGRGRSGTCGGVWWGSGEALGRGKAARRNARPGAGCARSRSPRAFPGAAHARCAQDPPPCHR